MGVTGGGGCVVVGVDGSQAGLAAARWAAAEAAGRHTALRVVQIQSPYTSSMGSAAMIPCIDVSDRAWSADVVRTAIGQVRAVAPDLPVTGEVIFDHVIPGLLAAGHQSQLLVLGCHSIVSRPLGHSWSCIASVASKAPVPVTVVEPWLTGAPAASAQPGLVVVLADAAAGIDRLVDYGCSHAQRRHRRVEVIAAVSARGRERERAHVAGEQALFDTLARCRERWPGLPLAGLVSSSKGDAEVRNRLARAQLVVVEGHRTRSLMRRCRLAGPLGLRSGPRALTMLPS